MWIFGYGSLMWGGWEATYGCTERLWADLAGYRRAFNKKSVENWGMPQSPGLTLNFLARPIAAAAEMTSTRAMKQRSLPRTWRGPFGGKPCFLGMEQDR